MLCFPGQCPDELPWGCLFQGMNTNGKYVNGGHDLVQRFPFLDIPGKCLLISLPHLSEFSPFLHLFFCKAMVQDAFQLSRRPLNLSSPIELQLQILFINLSLQIWAPLPTISVISWQVSFGWQANWKEVNEWHWSLFTYSTHMMLNQLLNLSFSFITVKNGNTLR